MGVKQFGIRVDILKKLTSAEADRVTGNLSTLYLRLLRAPGELWESEGVLRLVGEVRDGERVSAWERLLEIVKVPEGTAREALRWLEQEGVIAVQTGEGGDEIVISFEGILRRGGGG